MLAPQPARQVAGACVCRRERTGWSRWDRLTLHVVLQRRLVAAGAVALLMLGLSSCGSSSNVPELTGFGATTATWNAHNHKRPSVGPGCTSPFACYGDSVEAPDGPVPQFTDVSTSHDRIIGFTYNMASNTSQDRAMQLVKGLLPEDAKVTTTGQIGSPPDTCLVWNLRSAKLAEALPSSIGNKEGNIGVLFSTFAPTGGFTSFDPNNVNEARLTITEYKLSGFC